MASAGGERGERVEGSEGRGDSNVLNAVKRPQRLEFNSKRDL